MLSGPPPFASLTTGLTSQTLSSKASLKLYCVVSPAPKAPVQNYFGMIMVSVILEGVT